MSIIIKSWLWIIFCYLFASIPESYLLVKFLYKKDIRKIGQKKLSTSNVISTIGILPGIFVGAFDMTKGIVAIWGAELLHLSPLFIALSGIFALCGQMWPIFTKFHGGRGGSIVLGALLILNWKVFLVYLFSWLGLKISLKNYGTPIGMSLGIIFATLIGYFLKIKEIFIFSLVSYFLIKIKRVIADQNSFSKIKNDKKIILWRFLFDRDTKRVEK